jgi:diacylglycerol kinase (ATP)
MSPTSTCVIFNPAAKGDKARRFRRQLGELAHDWVVKPTTGPDSARALAREAVEQGFPFVVAAGGDGTVNEVINGLGDASDGFNRAALGMVPLGTANVYARELGIPLRLPACCHLIRQGHTRSVDLVRVTCQHQGQPTRRWFAQLAGAGLDARAVELVDWQFKKRAGVVAYIAAGLRALAEPQPTIIARTASTQTTGQLVLLGNGRLYGGPFTLFPNAKLADGQLNVRIFPRANWATALAIALGILTGRAGRSGHSTDRMVAELHLEASSRVPLELDGELVGELPASFTVAPQILRVVTPPAIPRFGRDDAADALPPGGPRGIEH